ncbi:pyruvate kinase [Desulfoprunum benzoelyticum]|uniref:Pyruvate kinase n=2 Tax=Desulfoprunum benzoelyticum TaxID=1506996 RepID=A0A840UTF8_9BACT|nr:pyruvate kinase [Desulfoprunum benzoelyticum]MBB5349082.1 pyruvate kinase [Desulfoprunum benzoelyticum]MBM9531822.1 pyruvate kinase [Desulfoprunum benzoelyticum]
MNKTKIIATLGPRSQTEDEVFAFINAGMNVARINLSHGDRQTHERLIDLVKKARRRAGTDTAILLDTRGPEIRVGDLKADMILEDGQELTITSAPATCSGPRISVNYPEFAAQIQEGHTILLDDGKLALTVIRIEGGDVITRVVAGGRLMSRKRVSLPDTVVNLPSLTTEDIDDIIFGIARNVDFIAASFVRSADDVWEVRRIIEEHGGRQAIIAKIENRQGVDNLDEILEAAEGLMVARGDLGVEMPAEEVPIIQKRIIHRANLAGKPVITATQMLESMITSPTPTRAEANDVTNAIFDGTDAVMLSAETATGRYPVEAIRFLTRCARISEQNLDYDAILAAGLRHRRQVVTDSISYACCATAADLDAAAIITATSSGSTARMVARHRPKAPIIAVSPQLETIRQLQLIRGVAPLYCASASTMDEQLDRAIHIATQAQFIVNGDLVVITAGMPLQTPGTTNMLKVHTVADICVSGQGIGSATAHGLVRIIETDSDWDNLPEEVIVVVSSTKPAMLEHLGRVKGIIAEQPGLTSHAAIVGRELGIPVVCNIPDATSIFENGQLITINGTTGHICYGSSCS